MRFRCRFAWASCLTTLARAGTLSAKTLYAGALCAGTLSAGTLHAQPSTDSAGLSNLPSPSTAGWKQVALTTSVAATIPDCPTLDEFSGWVDQLVGRPFVDQAAAPRLLVTLYSTESDELIAELLLLTTAAPQRLRLLRDRLDCEGMLRAMALSVSLLAEPAAAESSTLRGDGEFAPAALPVPGGAAETGATAAAAEPAAPQAPAAQPPATPAAARPPNAPLPASPQPPGLPAGAEQAGAEHADARAAAAWSLVGFGLASLGQNPGVGLGAGVDVRLRLAAWSVTGGGAYLASTGATARVGGERVRAEGPTAEARLGGCWHFSPEDWAACPQLGYWWMFARGHQFDRNLSELVHTAAVGGQLAAAITSGDAWQFSGRLELWVPLRRVNLEAEGEAAPVWSMWPVLPRAALALEWR